MSVLKKKHSQVLHATIPLGLIAGKITKSCLLMEPIRLQDMENSAPSQTWQKRINQYKLQLKTQLPLGTSVFENLWEEPDNH